ncbi:MAG: DUF4262 domain-containing protein [Mycobacterium sp.]
MPTKGYTVCWQCDHPGATRQDYLDVLRGKAMKNGWAVQYVETAPPFAYTIGLSEAGLPELLVTGLSPEQSMSLLNVVAHYLVQEVVPVPGDTMTFPKDPSVEFVEVTAPDVHMGWAVAFYGGPIRALQIAWRDAHGHSPWCPDFNSGGPRQPVLGVRGPVDT